MKTSIIISSYNRLPLLKRTLYSIEKNPPGCEYEVVVVDDGSTDDILSELKKRNFLWKFIEVDTEFFTLETGVKKFFNCPALTNNIGYRYSDPRSDLIFLQGNEVIAREGCYNNLIKEYENSKNDKNIIVSTTFDLSKNCVEKLDEYGTNLTHVATRNWPLQSKSYRSDVTNYISLCSKKLWEEIKGYDERYLGGISSEDSDFVRRCRKAGGNTVVSDSAISYHQYHGGKTCYYEPNPSVITKERFAEGVKHNHFIYHNWTGEAENPQIWPWGEYGVLTVTFGGKC